MINRKMKKYTVVKQDGYNNYNEPKYVPYKDIEISITLHHQNNVTDVRYKDATHLGFTKDRTLTDAMKIKISDELYYKITLINNDLPRYSQLFLQEEKEQWQ